MPAPACNTNASKWTLEKTQETLAIIEEQSKQYSRLFLTEVLDYAGIHRNTWQYWYTKWADNEEIIERMQLIDQRFEMKILQGAAYRKLNAGFATMLLKSKYGYVEERWKREKGKKGEE
jgi:hypothetical protein